MGIQIVHNKRQNAECNSCQTLFINKKEVVKSQKVIKERVMFILETNMTLFYDRRGGGEGPHLQ